ncbi:hypothetical protein XAP6164_5550003 [Xanthomonas phaseoli pv. phaseoli]|nr:hypothetical protein XAP6164_5550003 [Xanthomonas phaseoli pv. phaseoli]
MRLAHAGGERSEAKQASRCLQMKCGMSQFIDFETGEAGNFICLPGHLRASRVVSMMADVEAKKPSVCLKNP